MIIEKHSILVIEDDTPLREAIVMKLKHTGFSVIPAATAEDGMLMLGSIKPDMIWLDMLLPGMSGLQFLENLRKNEVYKTIPVIIVSALSDTSHVRKAFELNVVDFVTKIDHPIKEIVDQINNYFEKQD